MRAFLSALFLCLVTFALGQPYVIEDFNINIDLRPDGGMKVEEKIAVLFNDARRGIFRKIPVHYETGKGVSRDIWLSNISVTDEQGNHLTTKITNEGPYRQIRIGDENIYFDPGTRKTYVITYEADWMLNWFDHTDTWEPYVELYWNLTGDQWDTSIQQVHFRANFPKIENGKGERARLFYGPLGSTLSHTLTKLDPGSYDPTTATTMSLSESEVRGERLVETPPSSGLTLVLNLPSKAIPPPPVSKQVYRFLVPNLGFTIPLWVLLAMSFFWLRYGKDPDGGPTVVQFDPPDGLSGGEFGALLDESVDQRDIAAGVISLAVKGYLRIIPKEEGLIFKKRAADLDLTGKVDGADLSPFESKLLARLRACSGTIDESELRRNVAPYIEDLKNSIYNELVRRGYYRTSPAKARNAWGCGGLIVIIAVGILLTLISPFGNPLPAIVGGIIGAIIVFAFANAMPRRTDPGAKAHKLAKGFEEFVRRARKDELEWVSKKHPDQAMFEEYLPHAIAMGLTREWAQAFEGIVHAMPDWYATPAGTPFHPIYFANDLGTISTSVGSAAATPPRSSGGSGGSSGFSSGGGFSGGGFGGGGGGSW